MEISINIILLLLGFIGAIIAIGGDTWLEGNQTFFKRITLRGWLSIIILFLTLSLGTFKEIDTEIKEKELKNFNLKLNSSLLFTKNKLFEAEETRKKLELKLNNLTKELQLSSMKLQSVKNELSSLEPTILEGMFKLTAGIPREQDFSFVNLNSNKLLIPKSSRTKKQLVLYGGDIFEWHHYCRNKNTRFILDTNFRKYTLYGNEGEIRISGPIGKALKVKIENPSRVGNCGLKIIIRSTDQTRIEEYFDPLLKKIKKAQEKLK